MTVIGTLRAEGTGDHPVTLTGSGEENGGEWTGISLEPGSGESLLNYVEVGYGGSSGAMLNVKGASPTITNSTFRRSSSDAIRVQQSGHPTIDGNRFRNNQFGLRYEGEGKLGAPHNDWGCANGPKPTGCGDSVTSNVEWQPAVVLRELPRLCPGTTMLASSSKCLLQKFEPLLRYDSEENYFADSAAEITDNWGDEEGGFQGANESAEPYSNGLWDYDSFAEPPNGGVLAVSKPGLSTGEFQLSLGALGLTYPNQQSADSNDWLAEYPNYPVDAERLEAAGYMDFAYGRPYTDANGKRWLEYWYWYYYNPKNVAGIGKHEGDWESVLVGLDANNRPEEVIFSQHTGAANCYIGNVEQTEEGGPVVYVGLDSHATYQKPGYFANEIGEDWTDGNGRSVQPGLEIVDGTPPEWLMWPGHWGNTHPGSIPGEATSPTGPAEHLAWNHPDLYAADAVECRKTTIEEIEEEPGESAAAPPAAGIESVRVSKGRPEAAYHVTHADGEGSWPRLRISADRLRDGGLPPRSVMLSDVPPKGKVRLPLDLAPGEEAKVFGSLFYKNGRRVHLAPKKVRSP